MTSRILRLATLLLALATACLAVVGHARAAGAFPERPIRLVVPFPPGASTDMVGRLVAAKVSGILGQNVIVENRAGAGGMIGSEHVATSAPDGYTLLMATTAHTANPSIYPRLPYDTRRDFVPIAMLGDMPGVLVAHPSVPPDTLAGFVAYAKTHKLAYGSAGPGTFPHLSMERFRRAAGLDIQHIPYKGAAPALTDLVGGLYQVKMDAYISASGFIRSGRLKPYAVTSAQRMAQLPDVPTVAESGYPGFESIYWIGVVAPAGTPTDVRATLERAFIEAVHDETVSARLTESGTRPIGGSARELGECIDRELAQWPGTIAQANITEH